MGGKLSITLSIRHGELETRVSFFSSLTLDRYYINLVTQKSQWEYPVSPAIPPRTSPISRPPSIPQRKPIPSPSPRPGVMSSVSADFGSLSLSPRNAAATIANPAVSSHLEEDFDPAPWAMNTDAKFEQILNNLRAEYSVQALAVGIVSIDKPPKVHVLGFRKKDSPTPVTRADRFAIANNSNLIMTVLAILIDRNVFAWEDTIVAVLPRLARRIHVFHHQTTLAMLGAQLSGFHTPVGSAEGGDLYRYCQQLGVSGRDGRFAIALSFLGRPPDTTPGTTSTWHWANVLLLVLIMEERMRKPIEILAKELLFDPLQWYSAGFGRPDAQRNASSPKNPTQPWPHSGDTKEPINPAQQNLFSPLAFEPVDAVHSSIPDYCAFVDLHLRGSMSLPTAVLYPAAFKKLHTCVNDDPRSTPGGWVIAQRDWADGDSISTQGRSGGFASATWMAPLKGRAYFAVANIDNDAGVDVTDRAVYMAIRHDQS
jgi:CubicO group peptidase (beta-lactamase class C family)